MSTAKVLDADVFDTLELSALVYGGIGADALFEPEESEIPYCIIGHFCAVDDTGEVSSRTRLAVVGSAASMIADVNNATVHAINERKGKPRDVRVSWEEYCAELNIVRADS